MLLMEILDILPAKIYSRRLGKAVGEIMVWLKENYDCLRFVEVVNDKEGALPSILFVLREWRVTNANSRIPITSSFKKKLKELGIASPVEFSKWANGSDFVYAAVWQDHFALDKDAFAKGVFDDTQVSQIYGADGGSKLRFRS